MITYTPLSDEGREALVASHFYFINGRCFEFAIAAQEATNWPIKGLIQDGRICHVFLIDPQGRFFDARGFVEERLLGEPFGIFPPLNARSVTKEELMKILDTVRDPVPDDAPPEVTIRDAIQKAREFICAAWMEICSDEFLEAHSWAKKYLAFMEELEKLCKSHDVGIREMFETALPVLYPRYEDEAEAGFEVHPMPTDSRQVMFKRILK